MRQYSEKFREQSVRKLMPPNAMSVAQVSRETGVYRLTEIDYDIAGGRQVVTLKRTS